MIELPDPIRPSLGAQAHDAAVRFQASRPRHVVLDDFLLADFASDLLDAFPDSGSMPKSRDYVFGAKRELSNLDQWSPESAELHRAFMSPVFGQFLSELVGRSVFVDAEYLGGGFHAGREGSFLDLHTDFNVHPLHENWLRELNILVYLNPGWQPHWGGELLLTEDPESRSPLTVAPLFNRAVIMESTATSFHGYEQISFPHGSERRSIAAYAYSLASDSQRVDRRTTNWRPLDAPLWKRVLARCWNPLVLTKNRILGSGTAKNRRQL